MWKKILALQAFDPRSHLKPAASPCIAIAFTILLLAALPARAAFTMAQTFNLRAGWNAVWLEVTPVNDDINVVFQGLPLESVWTFASVVSSVDFIQNADEPVWNRDRWLVHTGISPSEPTQVRFRYQLEGYDRDWVEAGRIRVAGYAHLPPGPYQFRVRAVNNDGVWNEAGASVWFDVQPQFWQTRPFRGAMILMSVAALYAFFRLGLRRVEMRRAAQEAFARQLIASQEGERKRIAAELHDSLGQNLLVIKNRAALALKQRDDPGKMAEEVGEVSTMTSAALREVREIAQNLRPFQIDEFGLTKSIASMARKVGDASGMKIRTDLDDIDNALLPEFEINFYRIIQECLNNVAKHSQAKTASIVLRRDSRALQLTVRDDGCGFAVGRDTRVGRRGFGLKNITERARTMGGEVRVQSSPGEGTRVEVTIPVR